LGPEGVGAGASSAFEDFGFAEPFLGRTGFFPFGAAFRALFGDFAAFFEAFFAIKGRRETAPI
jgi:hypothetical protein